MVISGFEDKVADISAAYHNMRHPNNHFTPDRHSSRETYNEICDIEGGVCA
jgi:hypothetical protein